MGKTPFLLTVKYNLPSVSNARIVDLTVLHDSRVVKQYRPSELVSHFSRTVLLGKKTL